MPSEEFQRPGLQRRGEPIAEDRHQVGDGPEVGQAEQPERGLVEKDAEHGVGPGGWPLELAQPEPIHGEGRHRGHHPAVRPRDLRLAARARVAYRKACHEQELPGEQVEGARVDRIDGGAVHRGRRLGREPDGRADGQHQPSPPGLEAAYHDRQEKNEHAVHRQEIEEAGLIEERGPQPERLERVLEEKPWGALRAVAAGVLRQQDADQRPDERRDVPRVDGFCTVQRGIPKAVRSAVPQLSGVDPPADQAREEHEALGRGEEPERLVGHRANLGREVIDRHADEEQPPQRVKPQVAPSRNRFGLGLHMESRTLRTMNRSTLRRLFTMCARR